MEPLVKHRIVGVFVILSFLVIIAPVITKHSEPSWLSNSKDKRFVIPKQPKTVEVEIAAQVPKPALVTEVKIEPPKLAYEQKIEHIDKNIAELKASTHKVEIVALETHKVTKPQKGASTFHHKPLNKTVKGGQASVVIKNKGANQTIQKIYTLQLATFVKKKHADRLCHSLGAIGFNPYQKERTSAKGTQFFTVFVGKTGSKTTMQALQLQLNQQYKIESIIVKQG